MKRMFRIVALTLPLLALLSLWEFASASSNQTAFLIGRPSKIGPILIDEIASRGLLVDLGVTLACALVGLLVGTLLGFLLGLFVATNSSADKMFSPIINVLAVIPLFAAGPLIVFVAGQGLEARVLLSALSAGILAVALSYQHARLTPLQMIETIRIQAGTAGAALFLVQVPYTALSLITNLRILFGAAVMGTIVSEFLGASVGIGRFIVVAEGLFDVNRIWVGVVALSGASVIVGLVLARFEHFARRRLGRG